MRKISLWVKTRWFEVLLFSLLLAMSGPLMRHG